MNEFLSAIPLWAWLALPVILAALTAASRAIYIAFERASDLDCDMTQDIFGIKNPPRVFEDMVKKPSKHWED